MQPQTGEQIRVDHKASSNANQDLTNQIRPEPKIETPWPPPDTASQPQTALSEHPPHDTSFQDGVTTSTATSSPSHSSTSPPVKPSIPPDSHNPIPSSNKLPHAASDAPHSEVQSQAPTSIQDPQEGQPTAVHPAPLVVAEEASFEQPQSEHAEDKQHSDMSLEKSREQSQSPTKLPGEQECTPVITQPNELDSAAVVSKQNTAENGFQKITDLEHKAKEDKDLTPSDGGQETSRSSTPSDQALMPSGYINMPGTSESGSRSESLVQVSEEELSGSTLSQSDAEPEPLSTSHSETQLETPLDSETHSQRSTVIEDAAATTQEDGTTCATSNINGGKRSTSMTQEEGVDSKLETYPVVLDSQ